MKAISLLFYRLSLKLYRIGVQAVASRNPKAEKWLEGREHLFEKMEKQLQGLERETVWMHVSSLGEFEQGRTLLEMIKGQHPEKKVILTFFSPSGYEIRKNYAHADHVFYLPEDSPEHAPKLLDLFRPELVVFVKYDFWYYYFREVKQRQIPFILISALFRPGQAFFKWYGGIYKEMLGSLSHIFVQNEASAKLLKNHGYQDISIIPDTRVDRVNTISGQAKRIPSIEQFLAGEKAFIGGSVYDRENELIARAYHEGRLTGKIILAPHKVDKAHVEEIKKAWGDKAILYTGFHKHDDLEKYPVLIVDTIGLLSSLYLYGYTAFIGGGFGNGIHNTLEPAAFGLPVLFGPKYQKFIEAHALLAAGGAFTISSYEEFAAVLDQLQQPGRHEKAATATKRFIEENTGGTQKVMGWIQAHVPGFRK